MMNISAKRIKRFLRAFFFGDNQISIEEFRQRASKLERIAIFTQMPLIQIMGI